VDYQGVRAENKATAMILSPLPTEKVTGHWSRVTRRRLQAWRALRV